MISKNRQANVNIGTKFDMTRGIGKVRQICEVVDIAEVKSISTGEIIGWVFYAKRIDGLSQNVFDVLGSTIARYIIK